MTAASAIWQAITALGGERSTQEIRQWVESHHPNCWRDLGTTIADLAFPGSESSSYPSEQRFLERVSHGQYRIRQSGAFDIPLATD
jgi:hypothetical protein